MKERPIIFNDEMVRAILDGRKTQTRRVVKKQPSTDLPNTSFPVEGRGIAFAEGRVITQYCPYGQPGDRLWVREMWSGDYCYQKEPPSQRVSVMTPDGPMLRESIWYWADGQPEYGDWERPRPSIHMPRWASRITLEITSVRVERVQDIGEMDVIHEGFTMLSKDNGRTYKFGIADTDGLPGNDSGGWHWKNWSVSAQNAYSRLWQSIYGPDSWAANPWVWVIEFRRVE